MNEFTVASIFRPGFYLLEGNDLDLFLLNRQNLGKNDSSGREGTLSTLNVLSILSMFVARVVN